MLCPSLNLIKRCISYLCVQALLSVHPVVRMHQFTRCGCRITRLVPRNEFNVRFFLLFLFFFFSFQKERSLNDLDIAAEPIASSLCRFPRVSSKLSFIYERWYQVQGQLYHFMTCKSWQSRKMCSILSQGNLWVLEIFYQLSTSFRSFGIGPEDVLPNLMLSIAFFPGSEVVKRQMGHESALELPSVQFSYFLVGYGPGFLGSVTFSGYRTALESVKGF